MRGLLLSVIFFFFFASAQAQSLSELQLKKQNAAKEIEITSQLLSQFQKEEKASLNRLQLVNNNINQRNGLISGLNAEIKIYLGFIENNKEVIELIGADLENIKKEYAELIKLAYLKNNGGNIVLFLLSAENFNQAYRRLLFMRRYTSFRENQVAIMNSLRNQLDENIKKLEQFRKTRQQLLEEAKLENQKLAMEKQQQQQEILALKRQQNDLRKKLEQQRRVEQQLEQSILRIMEEEARKNSDTGEPAYSLTPEQVLVGNSFEQNKQKLPWPVERGIITEKFGIHRHAVLENVQVRNNGINIATEVGAKVRSVFDGEVTRVFGITGGNTAVIVRHGSYLTVYSNLREVTVKSGDKVLTRQNIGTVFTDFDDSNKSILKFQIWHENQKLDPEDWIGR